MDATVDVVWEDGQVTRHEISGLADMTAVELEELLECDLASYLDPAEMPLSPDGGALAWRCVWVLDIDTLDALHGFIPPASAAPHAGEAPAAVVAAMGEHVARPTRYERQLRIAPSSAYTHRRGTTWQATEMCSDQWQGLLATSPSSSATWHLQLPA
jgi:hypothetical protein